MRRMTFSSNTGGAMNTDAVSSYTLTVSRTRSQGCSFEQPRHGENNHLWLAGFFFTTNNQHKNLWWADETCQGYTMLLDDR